jgi:hypothetical protein
MDAMATYDLAYAQKHLEELFQEAISVEDVIIVRSDGRSCQLLPLADVKDMPLAEESTLIDLELPGAVPA